MIKIYVPKDSAARAVGADEVADAIVAEAASRKIDVEIIRNGSRGLLWLEPFVEVETPNGRVGFGGGRRAPPAPLACATLSTAPEKTTPG